MNTREFVKIGEDEQNIVFNEIDKEDELLFRKYMEASRHFQETFQLYNLIRYILIKKRTLRKIIFPKLMTKILVIDL